MKLDEATVVAYCAATLLAIGLWAALHHPMLRKRQVTISSLLLLMAMLGTAWGVVHFGMR